MTGVRQPDQPQWGVVSRIALIACALLTAGCGMPEANAGVAVVGTLGTLPSPESTIAITSPALGVDSASDRFQDGLPTIDVVAGPNRPPRPRTVAVVGDSLTLSAQDEITAALEDDGLTVIVVDGVESRRMTRAAAGVPPGFDSVVEILEQSDPDLWVFALGTNDVGAQSGIDTFKAEMGELLELLPPAAPVIWVDLWIRDRDDDIVIANRSIRTVLGDRQGVAAVVDWHEHAANPGLIVGDGVHLTDEGQVQFAAAIAHAIDTAFGS